jgi:CxxC motif-containing protein (DUF1111 family)
LRARTIRCGLPLVALAAVIVLVGVPKVQGELGLQEKDEDTTGGNGIGLPDQGPVPFCAGDICPGQTCDEVNDRCVGAVTLQPAMGAPLVGLTAAQLDRFDQGRVQFNRTFVVSDGLGPTLNQDGCGSCHNVPIGGSGNIKVTRFGILDFDTFAFDGLEELGGSLLQANTIAIGCEEVIPVPPTNFAAERVTNSTLGFGLVENIPDEDILDLELNPPDPTVSGRVHVVPVLENPGQTKVGRFGWKSQLATILSFAGDASVMEMGITNRIVPTETAANNDPAKLAACDTVPDPEDVPDAEGIEFVDRVTDFSKFLSPPPQTPRSGMTGEAIFNTIGCNDCHVRFFMTAPPPADDEADDETFDDSAVVSNKALYPYSDFLLHDMGFNADLIAQGDATPFELRTPPLWGLRVRDPLWHDGRVAGGTFNSRITNAIAQHNTSGSEAQPSAQAYAALPAASKTALIAFMNSLGRREFDHDGDGDVDDGDFLAFIDCFTGPGSFYTPDDPCSISDTDQDGDLDNEDLALIEVALGLVVDTPDDDPPGGSDDEDDEDDESDELGDSGTVDSPARVPSGFMNLMPDMGGASSEGGASTDAPEEETGAGANQRRGEAPRSSRAATPQHRGL